MSGIKIFLDNKRIKNVKLMIFDKDGTLIDIHAYWGNMIRLRVERLSKRLGLTKKESDCIIDSMGVDVTAMRIKPEGPVGIKKREIVLQAGVSYLISQGHSDYTDIFCDVFDEIDEISPNYFSDIIQPIEGLYPLIETLKECGCKIALATTDLSSRAERAMRYLGLDDKIDFIAGADMVKNTKPDSEIIELICDVLNVSAQNTVMVGDSVVDVETGINAGCLASIGVTSGITVKEVLCGFTSYTVKDIGALKVSCQ